jgi:hypothetical protein
MGVMSRVGTIRTLSSLMTSLLAFLAFRGYGHWFANGRFRELLDDIRRRV